MADQTPHRLNPNEMGCGLVGAIFQRKSFVRSPAPTPSIKSTSSLKHSSNISSSTKHSSSSIKSKRRRASSGENSCYLDTSVVSAKPRPLLPKHSKRPLDVTREKSLNSSAQVLNKAYTRKLRKEPTFTESELSMRIAVRQKSTSNGVLYRASSNNAMLLGHLGNLKQPGAKHSTTTKLKKTMNYHVRALRVGSSPISTPMLMGNIMRRPHKKSQQLGNILDSELLKSMGNENYKQGKFDEAIVLYSQAIAQDPSKASYYSNKSAALIGLGRLIEAVFDCRIALRIDPSYQRAHQRLAKLYLRLGDADKALRHYKQSGPKVDAKEVSQAEALKSILSRRNEAQRLKEWKTVEEESHNAILSGADSSPQVYAMKAEALLKLHQHQEAYSTIQRGPNYDTNLCIQFFGAAGCSNLLTIKAEVYMTAGRFEEAVSAAQCAANLDPNDESNAAVKRARALALARSDGNQLFKASKFLEASEVYTEGLQHQPLNSVLLCNRAACLSKLGEYEKAVEDCSAALAVRPSYTKAKLRRADCYSKLERWDAAVEDYEVLLKENPRDEEIERALYIAQVHFQKKQVNNGSSNLVMISSKEHFRRFIISPGMSVVLFCNKSSHMKLYQLMEQVCLRFPLVNFLKVEIEDNPYIMHLEDVNSVPAFRIYKNGSTIKEISGENCEILESSVKMISCTPYN